MNLFRLSFHSSVVTQSDEYLRLEENLFSEIQTLISSSLHHMKRTTNEIDHHLAHEANKFESNFEWVNCNLSFWLSNLVNHDFGSKA